MHAFPSVLFTITTASQFETAAMRASMMQQRVEILYRIAAGESTIGIAGKRRHGQKMIPDSPNMLALRSQRHRAIGTPRKATPDVTEYIKPSHLSTGQCRRRHCVRHSPFTWNKFAMDVAIWSNLSQGDLSLPLTSRAVAPKLAKNSMDETNGQKGWINWIAELS
jgi:hypothetical protein